MPYPTQHENFYKNQVIQLQQELEQLTETYQHRLNEAGILDRVVRAAAAGAKAIGRLGDDLAQTRANREWAEREAQDRARSDAFVAAAHNVPQTFAERLARFYNMSSEDIIRAINTGGADFQSFVQANWGRIVQSGTTPGGNTIYQRLLPDGTVLIQNGPGDWRPFNKPGSNSAFGYIGPNGQLLPPGVKPPAPPVTLDPNYNFAANYVDDIQRRANDIMNMP